MNLKIESETFQKPDKDPAKIRVLFVSHDGGMAGSQRTLLTLLATIDRSRFEPFLLVPYEGQLSQEVTKLEIPFFVHQIIHWVPSVNTVLKQRRFTYFINVLKTLRARSWAIAHLILRHQIGVVYTNTVTCVEGAVAARMAHIPHVWQINEPIFDNSELTPLLPFPFYIWAVNLLSKSVIFCSAILATSYPMLAKKGSVVHCGLPVPTALDRVNARNSIIKHFEIDSACKIVAVVGALQPRKDHFTFLEAAQKIVLENKDTVFLIVGTGSKNHTDLIRDKIKSLGLISSVILTGWWPEEIHELLAGLDVLVVSSEQESFGLTIIEALAMETPVVSTRCGGPEEVLENGRTGFLVPLHDPESMAEAIMQLLKNPQLARNIGQAGRKDVLSRFSVERYTKGIQQVIAQSFSKNNIT